MKKLRELKGETGLKGANLFKFTPDNYVKLKQKGFILEF